MEIEQLHLSFNLVDIGSLTLLLSMFYSQTSKLLLHGGSLTTSRYGSTKTPNTLSLSLFPEEGRLGSDVEVSDLENISLDMEKK